MIAALLAELAATPSTLLARMRSFVIGLVGGACIAYGLTWAHFQDRITAEIAARAAAVATAKAEASAETTRRVSAQQEIAHAAQDQAARAAADAASAARAGDALRLQLAAVVRAHARAADSAASAGGAPAGDPIGVLADVLGRADERAGILADLADRRGIAGAACERAYDALTATH